MKPVQIEEVQSDIMTGNSAAYVIENEYECHIIPMKYYSTGIIWTFLDLRRFRTYKTHSVRDLLRAIRNKVRMSTVVAFIS